MSAGKKVSVLMAVHNGANFIGDAIRSLIAQTYENWELLIVDNGSSDSTFEICSDFCKSDARIHLYSLAEKGKNRAYNLAFEKSLGDVICFMAADDLLVKESLQLRVEAVKGNVSSFSTCCLRTFSEDPAHDGIVFPKNRIQPNFSGGSMMFTREMAGDIFPIPEQQPNEDTWTSLHLRAFANYTHVPEPLYLYRIHSQNSYGYGLSFEEKRSRYLHRMEAFRLFLHRFSDKKENAFIRSEVIPFLKGLEYAEAKRSFPILFVKNLNLKSKLVLIFYCSPILYNIRYKYFKFLSGLLN